VREIEADRQVEPVPMLAGDNGGTHVKLVKGDRKIPRTGPSLRPPETTPKRRRQAGR